MTDYILQCTDLHKVYSAGRRSVEAVRGVDASVPRGEFVAVVGPSGCGKTTLLYLLGALARPSQGEVLIAGQPTGKLGDRRLTLLRQRHVGFVFQRFNLIPALSARANIELPLRIRGDGHAGRDEVLALMERIGILEVASRRPSQLSQGEEQRVAIARAVVHRPDVLMADEPTGNLDSENARRVMELLRDLNEAGQSVVLVTHDMDAARYASRIIRMTDGRIVESGASTR